MRLRDSIIISTDAAVVWPFLADPILQAKWNPKIVSVKREKSGPASLGERFEMIYRMSNQENHSQVEVTACQPSQRIVFLHRTTFKSAEQIVEEAYEIFAHDKSVLVTQTIDFTRAGIPWYFRALIWLVTRFGTAAEEPYLHHLKRLVEQGAV